MEHYSDRRYLVSFDSSTIPQIFCDVLVIGSGVAGLRAALTAAEGGEVLLIAKGQLEESNTSKAQGGVAVALAKGDSPALHTVDTLSAGQGLCDEAIVRAITDEAPIRIAELTQWGAKFDQEDGHIALTREGGHSTARIVHALGDATGKEVADTLIRRVRATDGIQIMDNTFVLDLLTMPEEGCVGALVHDRMRGPMIVWAKATVLACGGAGRLFRETTNSPIATGDGVAMAYRAGAVLTDIEFYQFHPTALYVAGAARALISEAVRGEGGILRNARGERFMPKYHELAELAPRDAVSRAIVQEIRDTGHTCAYVDVRHIPADRLVKRFPGIRDLCAQFDIDITREQIPIRPAAHYMIGGVQVDFEGRTNIPRLFACGEVACTGLHGANRLGSNSLLEGLVIGHHAGLVARATANAGSREAPHTRFRVRLTSARPDAIDVADVADSLRSLCWRSLGIERSRFGLGEVAHMLLFWGRYVMAKEFRDRQGWELQNMLQIASLISEVAQMREESRGVHFRTDFPQINDAAWKLHLDLSRDLGVQQRKLEPVA